MKKTCIFCGCRANTSEDVMPKWILRLLRKQERERVPIEDISIRAAAEGSTSERISAKDSERL